MSEFVETPTTGIKGGNPLEGLGISSTAERVYRAVLRDAELRVSDLVRELEYGRANIRAALDELVQLNLIRRCRDDSDRLWAISPEVGLTSLLCRRQQEIAERQHSIEASRSALAVLLADWADMRSRYSEPHVEHISGVDEVRCRIDELHRHCRYEVLSLSPGSVESEAGLRSSGPLDESALHRGVSIQKVFLDSIRGNASALIFARWLAGLGGEVRTAAILPIPLIIIDREVAFVPVSATDSRADTLLLHSTGAVAGLCALFDSVWRDATPLHARRRPRDEYALTAQERAILELLGQGQTDEMIARRIGVSVRTCRRVISKLMSRLRAHSRFQAGVHVQAAGWLEAKQPSD